MKKLLVMVIGAAAAFGASAIETGVGFENAERKAYSNATDLATAVAAGNYWAEEANSTNVYTVEAMDTSYYGSGTRPAGFSGTSTNALAVKTTFGKPLSFRVNAGGTSQPISTGVYFDSLVKFTVCEEAPDQTYEDAKIIMWLQEEYDPSDDSRVTGTNLMVRAGYLTSSGVVATNYTCDASDISADSWHRVTIKAINDITTAGDGVPAFAIFVDTQMIAIDITKTPNKSIDSSFTAALTEPAAYLAGLDGLFPSLVQGIAIAKQSLTGVQFDGTGSINELLFTTTPPTFAKDFYAPKATILVDGTDVSSDYELGTFAGVIAAVNTVAADESPVAIDVVLSKGVALDAPVTIAAAAAEGTTITLDFHGMIITNNIADCIITNNAKLAVIDSVGTGGIYANVENGGAIYQGGSGELTVSGGNFWANVVIDEPYSATIAGGSFQQNEGAFSYYDEIEKEDVYLFAAGKWLFADGENWYTIKDAFTVTFDPNNGEEATVIANVATNTPAGEISGIPETPVKAGYAFAGWTPDTNTTVIVSNTTFTAQWDANTVLARFYQEEGGTLLDSQDVVIGEKPVAPDPGTKTGYDFAGWTPDTNVAITVATDYKGTWTPKGYNVTYTLTAASEAGTPPTAGIYTVETTPLVQTLAQPAAVAGYTFSGWYNNSELTGEPVTTYTINTAAPADLQFWGKFTADTYTVTYNLDLDGATNAVGAVTQFTVVTPTFQLLPAGCEGYNFLCWTNSNGSVVSEVAVGTTANVEVFAKWEAVTPVTPTIDPANPSPVEVTAASEAAAIEAVALTPPSGSSADPAAYKALFNIAATDKGGDTWEVQLVGIKESVEQNVAASAEAILSGSGSAVAVPAGLYYKITTYTTLGGSAVSTKSALSDGTAVSVDKPGTTQGFIKVEMSTVDFD